MLPCTLQAALAWLGSEEACCAVVPAALFMLHCLACVILPASSQALGLFVAKNCRGNGVGSSASSVPFRMECTTGLLDPGFSKTTALLKMSCNDRPAPSILMDIQVFLFRICLLVCSFKKPAVYGGSGLRLKHCALQPKVASTKLAAIGFPAHIPLALFSQPQCGLNTSGRQYMQQ
jgi:hypothetical protein